MNKKGFTLIELLIVVAIIGIVAAIAIPNLLTAIQKAKQKSTMGDMKSIGTAVESYMSDNYRAPDNLGANSGLEPFHIKRLPLNDGWGNAWGYTVGGITNDVYSIGSGGRDGSNATGSFSTTGTYIVNSLAGFDNDIVFSNGTFTYGPRVK